MKWESVPVRRLVTALGGSWGTEPEGAEVVAPCIRGTDFDMTALRTNVDQAPLRGFDRREYGLRNARRGDLIIEKSGGGATQPVGRVVLHDADRPVVPTNFAARLRPTSRLDPMFGCYLFAAMRSDGRTMAVVKQTTGIQNLDLDALLGHRVDVPELTVQRAIAHVLDSETARIDALIVKKQDLASRLVLRLHAAIEDLIFRDTVGEWARWPKIANVADLLAGYSFSSEDFLDRGPIRLLRGVNVEPGGIRWLDVRHVDHWVANGAVRFGLSAGDLVMGMDRPQVSKGLRLARVTTRDLPAMLVQRVLRIRPTGVDAGYAYYAMIGGRMAGHLEPDTTGVSVPHVSERQIGAFRIPLPGRSDQRRIAERLQHLDTSTEATTAVLDRQVTLLRERRQALITAAVTGELEVPGVSTRRSAV